MQDVLPDMLSRPCLDDIMPDNAIPVRAFAMGERNLLGDQRTNEFVKVLCSHLRAGSKPEATSEEVEELLKIWDRLKVENDNVVVAIDGRKVPF
ncbi:unnamed protein product, partial [Dicrocoelium dendriticum]